MTDRLDKYSQPRAVSRRAASLPAHPDLAGIDLAYRFKDVIARRWLTALIVLLVVVGGVAIGTQFRDPVYRATGLLEIRSAPGDTPSVDALLASRRVSDEVLETEVGMLRSSALAGRVIDALNLSDDPTFTRDAGSKSKQSGTDTRDALAERQALLDQLRKHLTIDPQQGRLVAVSYDASDPDLAARVVNGVLDCYTKWRMEDTSATSQWLTTQIAEAQKQLQASEQRLQAHVRRNGLQIIDTGQGESTNLVNDRLRQLQTQLADVQVDRYQKQSDFENAESKTRELDQPVIQSLSVRLADLQREYASLRSTFLDDYPKVQQVKEQIAQVQKSLDEEVRLGREALHTNYQSAMRREALLMGALASQQKTAQSLVGGMAAYESLKREVATNQQLYTTLDQKLKEVTIAAGLRATNLGVVDRASPLAAASLNFPLSITLGLASCVGLLLGLGLAFVKENTDRSVRSVTQVDAHLGYPALAVIPAVPGGTRRSSLGTAQSHVLLGSPAPAIEASKQASLSEAFAALRTSVMLNNNEPPPNSLLITSASAGEGKTTVAVNLAMSLARLNERVLLIDFDLRRPSVHTALGLAREPGLSNCLMGEADWRKCLQSGPVDSMDVLPAGRNMAEQSAELAMSPRMRELLTAAEEEYDFVIIDSAPVLIYPADVRTLAALVDGTLLTVRSGYTSREAVRDAWSQVRRPLGIVLNATAPRETPAYGYPDYGGDPAQAAE